MRAGSREKPPARTSSAGGARFTCLCRLACFASASDVTENARAIAIAADSAFMGRVLGGAQAKISMAAFGHTSRNRALIHPLSQRKLPRQTGPFPHRLAPLDLAHEPDGPCHCAWRWRLRRRGVRAFPARSEEH